MPKRQVGQVPMIFQLASIGHMAEVDVVSIMQDEAMAVPSSQGCACLQ